MTIDYDPAKPKEPVSDMRRLVIISGSLGVGKTTIAEKLLYSISNAAWIDSDQTWWSTKPDEDHEENFPYILDNTIHCINNYLRHGLDPIFASWFFPRIEQVLQVHEDLCEQTELVHYLLTASRRTLAARHRKRGDTRPYEDWMMLDGGHLLPSTVVIDTERATVDEIVQCIMRDVRTSVD